jgi:hypothetical protein
MRRAPAWPGADLDAQRHVSLHGRLGGLGHDPRSPAKRRHVAFRQFEHEFVMDLEQHPHVA